MGDDLQEEPASKVTDPKELWDKTFEAAIRDSAYNLVPPEPIVRTLSYFLRSRYKPEDYGKLRFLDLGCGAGATIIWLARKGLRVSGIDISPEALKLCEHHIDRRLNYDEYNRVSPLKCGNVTNMPWDDETFDGICSANVLQHLNKEERVDAFSEIRRLLKRGGCYVGYEMSRQHCMFNAAHRQQLHDDPGTIIFEEGGGYGLGNVGLTHFFSYDELFEGLRGFISVDPCSVIYQIPVEEAKRRHITGRIWAFWNVLGVK